MGIRRKRCERWKPWHTTERLFPNKGKNARTNTNLSMTFAQGHLALKGKNARTNANLSMEGHRVATDRLTVSAREARLHAFTFLGGRGPRAPIPSMPAFSRSHGTKGFAPFQADVRGLFGRKAIPPLEGEEAKRVSGT